MAETISYQQLLEARACIPGRQWFFQRWGTGEVSFVELAAALAEHPNGVDWWEWLASFRLLSGQAEKLWLEVRRAIFAACDRKNSGQRVGCSCDNSIRDWLREFGRTEALTGATAAEGAR